MGRKKKKSIKIDKDSPDYITNTQIPFFIDTLEEKQLNQHFNYLLIQLNKF